MPHRPLDDCLCRKPKPGLILQAAALRLDLPGSILIGDTWNDILASAGVGRAILVRAGLGAAQAEASPP
ncbi:MAG: HAD hydrolase-like protein, partial [Anaerolineales bacterium]